MLLCALADVVWRVVGASFGGTCLCGVREKAMNESRFSAHGTVILKKRYVRRDRSHKCAWELDEQSGCRKQRERSHWECTRHLVC